MTQYFKNPTEAVEIISKLEFLPSDIRNNSEFIVWMVDQLPISAGDLHAEAFAIVEIGTVARWSYEAMRRARREDEDSSTGMALDHSYIVPKSVVSWIYREWIWKCGRKNEESGQARSVRAKNATAPEELEKLAEDEEAAVRYAVAGNPNTSVSVLEKLAEDEEEGVRERVAENPNTPISVLELLAYDEHHDVRLAVVESPNTPDFSADSLDGSE